MKKLLTLISIIALALTLTLLLSGCSGRTDELEGKNIVTFMVNGGVLNYGTSSTKTSVNFAYYPGTYILDPSADIPNYSISRSGYDFTGWYTDEACTPSSKWDFDTIFDKSSLTLYAGWEKSIRHTYSVYYVDEETGEAVKLGDYSALAGDTFSDWKDVAEERENYTCIGFYSDKELTTPWDDTFTHPGGESDLDITVYADYIKGEWKLAGNFEQLKHAVLSGNVYLTADIDCQGKDFSIGTYSGIFQGNGYKVSNFKVAKSGGASTPTSGIFKKLAATAQILNVTFENVTYSFTDIKESTATIQVTPKVASLTVDMQAGAKVDGVTITGTLITNYTGELNCLNSVYYYAETPDEAVMAGVSDNFSASITVSVQ
jgi:uncharacterized repeat protein (TIGR02543 family)